MPLLPRSLQGWAFAVSFVVLTYLTLWVSVWRTLPTLAVVLVLVVAGWTVLWDRQHRDGFVAGLPPRADADVALASGQQACDWLATSIRGRPRDLPQRGRTQSHL